MNTDTLVMTMGPPNPPQKRWVEARFERFHYWPRADGFRMIPETADDMIALWLAETALPYVLLMHVDVVPVAATERIVEFRGIVGFCSAVDHKGCLLHGGRVNMKCLKLRRAEMLQLDRPRIAWGKTVCECIMFDRLCRKRGWTPECVGQIGHRFPVTHLPSGGILYDRQLMNGEHKAQRRPT